MLGAVFVVQGAQILKSPERVASRAKPLTDRLTPLLSKAGPKMPTEAEDLVKLNAAVHVGGGLLMVTSLYRPAAAALAASMVPTTLAGHAFWEAKEPAERSMQRVQFLKNLSLLGGLILAAVDTEGRPSLSYRVAAGRSKAEQARAERQAKAAEKAKTAEQAKVAERAKAADKAKAVRRAKAVNRAKAANRAMAERRIRANSARNALVRGS